MKETRKRSGFTLVELIIVIAVIGVLAAILIPIFANVIENANAKSALSDARNAIEMYVTDSLSKAADGTRMPENITVIVEKGSKYYLFGYNTAASGYIMISSGNPFPADNAVDLLNRYSWNSLQGTNYNPNEPQNVLESYSIATHGAFYLVPYSGQTADNPNVRGFRDTVGYRLLNNEMESITPDSTAIYHGCLVGLNFTYEGSVSGGASSSDSSATPTPSTTPVTHTISLDLNGVTASQLTDTSFVTSYTVNHGDDLASAGTPVLADGSKTFAGWYENDTEVTFPMTDVQGDHILTAHWQTVRKLITISDEWNGHHADISGLPTEFAGGLTWNAPLSTNLNTLIDGLSATLNPTVAGVDGTAAIAWTINGTAYDSGVAHSLTENVTIAPVFGDATYTIRFYDGSSEITALRMTNIAYNATDIALPNESTTGNYVTYGAGNHFRGWKLDNAGTAVFTYTGHVTADKSFTVSLGAYKVDFYNPNNGANLNATVKTGDTYYVPTPTLTSNMYYHSSWTVSSGAAACAVGATEYTANKDNITITAVESSKSVNVTFTAPAGASNVPASGTRSFATDGNTINLGTPTLEHHNTPVYAVTATDNASGTISGTTLTLSTSSTGSITVTLTFTADPTYSVTYNANGGSGTAPTDSNSYYADDTVTLLANTFTPPTGKHFTGWKINNTGELRQADYQFTLSASTEIYAQWDWNTYTVTFTDGTNTQNAATQVTHGVTVSLASLNPLSAPSNKELDKFTIGGTDYAKDASYSFTANNTTVTVVWKDVATAPSEPVVDNPVLIIRFVDYDLKGSTSVSQAAIKADCYDGHEGDFKEYRFASLPTSDGNLGWDSQERRIQIGDTAEETLKVTFTGYNWPYVGNTTATQSKKYGIYNSGVFSTSINVLKTQLNAVKEGDVWVWYITVKELPSASPNIINPAAIIPVPYEDR